MQLTDAQLWAAGLGYVLPPVVAIVAQPRWTGAAKTLLMLAVAAVVGVGTDYFEGDFTGKGVVTSALTAAVALGAAYHSVWKPSGIAPAIERATSPGDRG